MITATITEYLEIWPRVFSYMVTVGILMTVFMTLVFLLALIPWFTPISRINTNLTEGFASAQWNVPAWVKKNFLLILYFAWGSLLLVPVISFVPIIVFDFRTQILFWYFLSLFVAWFLYDQWAGKIHGRLVRPQYYIIKECLGIRAFGGDILIPPQAILELTKDNPTRRIAIKIESSLGLIPLTGKATNYLQFSTQDAFEECIARISQITVVEWQEKSLTTWVTRFLNPPVEDVQYLPEDDLENYLPAKTLTLALKDREYAEKSIKPRRRITEARDKVRIPNTLVLVSGLGLCLSPFFPYIEVPQAIYLNNFNMLVWITIGIGAILAVIGGISLSTNMKGKPRIILIISYVMSGLGEVMALGEFTQYQNEFPVSMGLGFILGGMSTILLLISLMVVYRNSGNYKHLEEILNQTKNTSEILENTLNF
ncbi:MAG: hypothetical protein ACXAC8_17810 [Candidatus Hodarchaeales archaeon]